MYLCLSVCACMCVCVWACVYVIQGLLSQVWPRVTCLLCLLCPRTLESRGLVPPPAKNTPGLHTDQGRIHPMQCFQGCTITNDEKAKGENLMSLCWFLTTPAINVSGKAQLPLTCINNDF